jgi:hypothetical protein
LRDQRELELEQHASKLFWFRRMRAMAMAMAMAMARTGLVPAPAGWLFSSVLATISAPKEGPTKAKLCSRGDDFLRSRPGSATRKRQIAAGSLPKPKRERKCRMTWSREASNGLWLGLDAG